MQAECHHAVIKISPQQFGLGRSQETLQVYLQRLPSRVGCRCEWNDADQCATAGGMHRFKESLLDFRRAVARIVIVADKDLQGSREQRP